MGDSNERSSETTPHRQARFVRVAVLLPIDRRVVAQKKENGLETLVDFSPESQTFTYGIPLKRLGQYRAGQVVWVPFGRGRQQGVILDLAETAPEGVSVKPLGDPVTAEPALSTVQLDLGRWLSRHYLAPLSECVKLILPPGFGARSQVLVEYVPGAPIHPADLSAQQALLLRLRREPMALRELRKIDRKLAADDVLGALLGDGLLRLRDQEQGRSRPKPKIEKFVRPVAEAAALDALTRAPRQRQTLAWLLENAPDGIAQRELLAEIDAKADAVRRLADKGLVEIDEIEVWRDPLAGREFSPDVPPTLTDDQRNAWARISAGLEEWLSEDEAVTSPPVYLLHGVTGSGKTELYLRALRRAVEVGRQGIVLVPEISLTPQTVRRFAARFPGRVAVVHSKLSDGERYDTWRRAKLGEIDVVVGSRSALFTPLPRIGVIVIDEEHDGAYKQIRTPRYHARDAAIELARLEGAITMLGSATPSLESMFQARRGAYQLLELPRRVMGHLGEREVGRGGKGEVGAQAHPAMLELPPVEVIDMREELRAGNRSMFSRTLRRTLTAVLSRGEQAILFLNRRGSSSHVLCRDCGHVMHCPRCAIPLTHHGYSDLLICHHCNHRENMPKQCPTCNSRRFRQFGAGTERVLAALKAEFPAARPLRWDRDTTGGKTSHEDILQDFIDHKADVLVGTQMIAKGLDLPLVTLVGVLSADVGMFLPDFRAAERVFQVLTQVAGRAGRSALGGEVIFQTYHPQNPAILAAAQHDYAAFYRQEMTFRQTHGYPPYRRFARLLYTDGNRERCEQETALAAAQLQRRAAALELEEFSMIGPAPAFFSKERGKFRWHIIFRAADPAALLSGVPLTPGWRIDVDPVETL